MNGALTTGGDETGNRGRGRSISHFGDIISCGADPNFQGYNSDYPDSSNEERVIHDEVDSDIEDEDLTEDVFLSLF